MPVYFSKEKSGQTEPSSTWSTYMYFFREVGERQFIPVMFFKEKFKSTDIMHWPRIFFPEGGGEWDEGIRDCQWGIGAMFTLILVCKY